MFSLCTVRPLWTLCRCLSSRTSSGSITSADLIAKWQVTLQLQPAHQPPGQDKQHDFSLLDHSSTTGLHTEQLRQLCQDAIHVYSTEGATTVVPDRVTDIFMAAYQQLQTHEHKLRFFKLLVSEFGVQAPAIEEAIRFWLQRAPAESASHADLQQHSRSSSSNTVAQVPAALLYRLAERLSAACQPLYMQLLLPVSQHKAGIKFLVTLRADLLALLKHQPATNLDQHGVALRALDQDLRSALARWFSLGLLQLHRITWENSSGQLLQRVQQTEAVHKMQHLEELQRRLQQSDRRVFAFMHPSLPEEPLVVLHTAIMTHVPCSMQEVLAPALYNQQQSVTQHINDDGGAHRCSGAASAAASGQSPSVACFYSISSSQKGLAGVDLGNFLIKKAAQLLLAELPQLQTLVTLSPIPGFRSWLITKLRQAAGSSSAAGDEPALLQEPEADAVLDLCSHMKLDRQNGAVAAAAASCSRGGDCSTQQSPGGLHLAAAQVLLRLVHDNSWATLPPAQQDVLRPVLLRLCAVYLLLERRRNFALDPVAHFHLRNGAQLWRINWSADMSAQGLLNSCGLMVNYLYDMDQVTNNNQQYLVEHYINAAEAVTQLLKQDPE